MLAQRLQDGLQCGSTVLALLQILYSHVIPGMRQDAAAMVDAAPKPAAEKRQEKNGSNPAAGRIGVPPSNEK
jgi:hypothetical protein